MNWKLRLEEIIKEAFVIVFFLLLAGCCPAVYGQTYFKVHITVEDQDDAPIVGAKVVVAKNGGDSFSGFTDGSGQATIEVRAIFDSTFDVTVTKRGYLPWTTKIQAKDNKRQPDIDVGAVLAVEAWTDVVVEVKAADNGQPVIGALAVMVDDFYSATTDARGIAILRVPPGSYRLRVSSGNFKGEEKFVMTSRNEKQVAVGFSLLRAPFKEPNVADLWVTVLGRQKDGTLRPLAGAIAQIAAIPTSGITGPDGKAYLYGRQTKVGDDLGVIVTADGYKPGRSTIKVTQAIQNGATASFGLEGSTQVIMERSVSTDNKERYTAEVAVHDNFGKPIAGATVGIWDVQHPEDAFSGTTDANGRAQITIYGTSETQFGFMASKSRYADGRKSNFGAKDIRNSTISLMTILKSSFTTVNVEVKGKDTNLPLPGIVVTMIDRSGGTTSAITDESGRATLMAAPGENTLSVAGGNYKAEERSLSTSLFDEQRTESFVLESNSRSTEIGIRVLGKNEQGVALPLANASVYTTATNRVLRTDSDGWVTFKVDLTVGDQINVTADADGFRQGSGLVNVKAVTLGGAGGFAGGRSGVVITLERTPAKTADLIVRVVDSATDKPVPSAKVRIETVPSTGERFGDTTDENGETMELPIPVETANKGLRVIVEATDFAEKWSDIAPELLQGGERRFTVYLTRRSKFPDVSGVWKADYAYVVRTITQNGNKIFWTADYMYGPTKVHETAEGTVSESSGGSASVEVTITYTMPTEPTKKGTYTASISVDSNGKATKFRWNNGDVYVPVAGKGQP